MPKDEFGNKWACSPCVRGHRAMKCAHWDRLMMQVRKPGRPLTDCPHPKHQNCGCSSKHERVKYRMIMIQRDQECLCRIDERQPFSTLPHEVQNHGFGEVHPHHGPNGNLQAPNLQPYQQQIFRPGYPPASASGQFVHATFDHGSPNAGFPAQVGHQQLPTTAQQQQFAVNMNALQQSLLATTMATDREGLYAFSEQPKASCCLPEDASKAKPVFPDATQDTTSGLLRDTQQTALYRIPPGFATYDNPMKPEQQAELGRSDPDYMQTIPAYSESGFVGTAALPAETNESSNGIMATVHSCSCGISCQCLACPVHPGNETTQARVEELDRILSSDLDFLPTTDDISAWSSSLADDGAIMANYNEETPFLPISPEELALGRQSEVLSHSAASSWAHPISSAPYPTLASAPSLATHPNTHSNGNETFPHDGGNDNAMLSQRYFYYHFPVHHPNESESQ